MEFAAPSLATGDYFIVDVKLAGVSACLSLKGELDLGSAETLSDALTAIESAGSDPLIIDMAEVRFLDCSGLSVLLGAYNRACRDDRDIFITNAQPAVRRIFILTGCKHLLSGAPFQDGESVEATAGTALKII